MRLRRSSYSGAARSNSRRLRTDDCVELPRNYEDKIVYDDATELFKLHEHECEDMDSQSSTDFEFDISVPEEDEEWNYTPPYVSDDNNNNDNFETTIPQLDLNELIVMANQLVRSAPPSYTRYSNDSRIEDQDEPNSTSTVHIRFPLIRSINEARDVILQYERDNGGLVHDDHFDGDDPHDYIDSNNNDNENESENENENENISHMNTNDGNIRWDSITQDYSGILMSGTRTVDSHYRAVDVNIDNSEANHDHNNHHNYTGNHNINVNVNLNNNMNVEHIHRQPVWLELAGLVTVTMFLFAVYRLVKNLVSISAFSDNVLGDVLKFIEYVNDGTYYKSETHLIDNTSLVYKFSLVIKSEMPYLPDTIWLLLTVIAFTTYTVLTSGIVLTSMLFATMCLTMCVVIRWRHLGDFILRVFDNGEGCL